MINVGMKEIKIIFQGILTLLMFLGMFFLFNSLINDNIPVENKDVVHVVIGYLSGAFSSGIAFWFRTNVAIDKVNTNDDNNIVEDEK